MSNSHPVHNPSLITPVQDGSPFFLKLMLIFGIRQSSLIDSVVLDGFSCENCGMKGTISVSFFISYLFASFFPAFPTKKHIISSCAHCNEVRLKENFYETLELAYEATDLDTKVPWKYYLFTMLFGAMVMWESISSFQNQPEIAIGQFILGFGFSGLFFYIFRKLEINPYYSFLSLLPFGGLICIIMALVKNRKLKLKRDPWNQIKMKRQYYNATKSTNSQVANPSTIQPDILTNSEVVEDEKVQTSIKKILFPKTQDEKLLAISLISAMTYCSRNLQHDEALIDEVLKQYPHYIDELTLAVVAVQNENMNAAYEYLFSLIRLCERTLNTTNKNFIVHQCVRIQTYNSILPSEEYKDVVYEIMGIFGYSELAQKTSYAQIFARINCP